MSGLKVLMEGVAFGESPRWHDGRLWFSDWGAQEVVAVDEAGNREVIVHVEFLAFPMCIDFAADGGLLLVAGRDGRLLHREPDGSLAAYADLASSVHRPLPERHRRRRRRQRLRGQHWVRLSWRTVREEARDNRACDY